MNNFLLVRILTRLLVFLLSFSGELNADDNNITTFDILDKYTTALGGEKALSDIETRFVQGYLVKDLHWDDPPYDVVEFVAYSKAPSMVHLTYFEESGNRIAVFDGKEGWLKDPEGIRPDENIGKPKLSWVLNPQNVLNLKKYFSELQYAGTELVNGKPAYVLDPIELDKEHYTFYIDIDTGLLVRIGYNFYIMDYEEIEGIMVPTRIMNSRKGGSYTYKFKTILQNIPIEDAFFSKPHE